MPTRLLRLRAPPHVRASLPSSDSSRPLTRTALSTFLVVLMFATHLTVENQASGLQLRPLPVGLPFPQELDLNLNDRVQAYNCHAYSCMLCLSSNMITGNIKEKILCTRKWFVHYGLLTRKLMLSV